MIKPQLSEYLEKTFLFQFDEDITETTDLFKAGVLDSHGYINLIKYIEDTFQVRLSKIELLSNVITTLSGMVALIESKRACSARRTDDEAVDMDQGAYTCAG